MNTNRRTHRPTGISIADVIDLFSAATHATTISMHCGRQTVRTVADTSRKVISAENGYVVLAGSLTGSRSVLDLTKMVHASVASTGILKLQLPGDVQVRILLEREAALLAA